MIPFPQWAPDITDLGPEVSSTVLNVVPRADGYGPFKDFVAFTSALAANCRGYFFARNSDGGVTVFAASANRIYTLNTTTFGWTDVSKGATNYTSPPTQDNWQFRQFNNRVVAVQANVPVQSFILGSSTAFADLGGSPPQARYVAIVGRFIVLTGLLNEAQRVQWSDLDDPTEWTAGIGQSDFQDLPDGGIVYGIAGTDQSGHIFQDSAIRIMIYVPGSPVIFEFQKVSNDDGLFGPQAIVSAGDRTFFCSRQGFKEIRPGGYPTPIGAQRIDRTFFADIDRDNLRLFIGANDPSVTRAYWAYKSLAGKAGEFDTILCCDWSLPGYRWSKLRISGQYLASLAKPGMSLEALDTIALGQFTISGAANNGSGLIRLTLNATSNAYTNLANENTVVVYGVVGTTEANATWRFTIIDATHIDLIGSTFTNAYVSGGKIGGSLDALPFSLDDISLISPTQLSMIDPDKKMGFFSGDNLEATIDTGQQNGEGRRTKVLGFRPITDADDAVLSTGYRSNAQEALSYTDENAINDQGISPQRIDCRYFLARARIPAAAAWTYITGVEPIGAPTGKR